jgi:hypothetical protein
MPIQSPYEILELGDGGKLVTNILKWELGNMTINRRSDGVKKDVQVLRIFIPHTVKPIFPDYYDLTSTTLIAQLLPHLQKADYTNYIFTITKHGVAPRARFTLDVAPMT